MSLLTVFQDKNFTFEEVYNSLRQSSYPSVDFYVLMFLSTIIAALGLLLNSGAIVIGAMLIAPLMDPLLGVAFSGLWGNRQFKLKSLFTIITGIFLGLIVSMVVGALFSFMGETPELMARTQPTTLDLLVALASGFMGGYAKVRRTVGGSIFGVAIAISLVPPLSAVGIGLAFQQSDIYLGASLLFLANVMSVILSSSLAFVLLEFDYIKKDAKSLLFPLFSILLIAVPLTLSLNVVMEKRLLSEELQKSVRKTLTFRRSDIVAVDINPYAKPIRVSLTARTADYNISSNQVQLVQEYLARKVGKPVHLTVNLTPVMRIEGTLPRISWEPPIEDTVGF